MNLRKNTLNRPVHGNACDPDRNRNDDAPVVPYFFSEPFTDRHKVHHVAGDLT